jgi:5-formaminoimidazole-4-carboxamide-1-(beta)-D-ribofuranosyl 5'-monophosphate synthetase
MTLSEVLSEYDPKNLTIAALASHSMLEIAKGAKEHGMRTLAICQKGREKTYSQYYKTRGEKGIIDDVLLLDDFKDILQEKNQKILKEKNVIFVPHRSFQVYTNFDYDTIENDFSVPVLGNKFLLRAEERNQKNNQYDLMQKAGIRIPKHFSLPSEIDRLCIVKVLEKDGFERKFFLCSDEKEFNEHAKELLNTNEVTQESLDIATIEEFVLGAQINFNYFYSALNKELELVGTDTRRQTNLDGILRIPPQQQGPLTIKTTYEEAGHVATTVVESLLEKAFDSGEKMVAQCTKEFKNGLSGPFALQGAITSEMGKKEIVVFDASFRMPGSPGIAATPYSSYVHGHTISMGERVSMEIKQAAEKNQLEKILS